MATLQYEGFQSATADAATFNFNDLPVTLSGQATSRVHVFAASTNPATTISSVLLDGASPGFFEDSYGTGAQIAYACMTHGASTVDIQVNYSGSVALCGVGYWSSVGLASSTPEYSNDFTTDGTSGWFATEPGGFVLAGTLHRNSGGTGVLSSSGADGGTVRYSNTVESSTIRVSGFDAEKTDSVFDFNLTYTGGSPSGRIGYMVAHDSFGELLEAATASYAWTVNANAMMRTRQLAAAAATYSWSAQAAAFVRARYMTATAATYSWSAQAAGLLKGLRMAAAAASYAWTGVAAGQRRTYAIKAAVASYAWSAQAVIARYNRVLKAAVASYSWTGQTAQFLKGFRMSAAVSTYTWTAQALTLLAARRMAAALATYIWSPKANVLAHGRKLVAAASSYAWTVVSARLVNARRIAAVVGAYVWSPQANILRRGYILHSAATAYTWAVNAIEMAVQKFRRKSWVVRTRLDRMRDD